MSNRFMRIPLRSLLGAVVACLMLIPSVHAQQWINTDDDTKTNRSMFRPLEAWPDPNEYRNAAGFPGKEYWQQQVDYKIDVRLDPENHFLYGSERVTYHNNSPDELDYVWVQLDQNVRSIEHSRSYQTQAALPESYKQMPAFVKRFLSPDQFDGGHNITRVQLVGSNGSLVDAEYRIRNTIMKINLLEPLQPGASTEFEIDWNFRVPDNARGAKEEMQDGWLYVIAQWFPRLNVYDDVNGWQTDQFLGRGEFYLNFGDYDVKITVPWDHIVDATGILQNPEEVLTSTQMNRLEQAYQSEEPAFIIGADEVGTPNTRPTRDGMLTWHFKAEDVRDFAFASSRTFVWDAAGYQYDGSDKVIKVHSLYPKEGMPLWDKVSTRSTIQTLETYGRMALEYPYPKAINVNGPVGGMEYPMVAFCGARPGPDGTYTPQTERALVSVTIHEVGHNWYPMIVATDERKWTWMDEGLTTFLQYYTEQDYAARYQGTEIGEQFTDGTYPSRRGPAKNIVDYMRNPNEVPIMSHSDIIPMMQFGNNGYAKPATGLVVLREQILGPEVFDDAFRAYSKKWAFKHPQPADFFRAMEEGAGENLNYFWRGWFYTTHYNDQAITSVSAQATEDLLDNPEGNGQNYYRVEIQNEGGLLLPVQMEVTYEDGTTERMEMPVDIWRYNEKTFRRGFFTDKTVVKVELDPDEVLADVNLENNVWEAPEIDESEVGN